MHQATRRIPHVPRTYASQVPLPASVYTRGSVTNGVSVGQAPETDCASVSIGERDSRRKPYPAAFVLFSASPATSGESGVMRILFGEPFLQGQSYTLK